MESRPHSLHLLGRVVIEHLRLSIYIRAYGERSNDFRPSDRERGREGIIPGAKRSIVGKVQRDFMQKDEKRVHHHPFLISSESLNSR